MLNVSLEFLLFNDSLSFFNASKSPFAFGIPRDYITSLYNFYIPICIAIGLTGNIMVWILIKSNRMLRKLPTNTYLLCLAAMSSIFLCALCAHWLDEVAYLYFSHYIGNTIFKNSQTVCKINVFLAHLTDFSSVWLIVLVGFERLILLYRKSRSLTIERARAQVICLLTIGVIFNLWILIVAELDENLTCDIDESYIQIYNIMTIIETVICMVVPSFIIILSNVLVVIKLNHHLRRNPSSPSVSFNTADVVLSTAATSAPSHTIKTYTRASLGRISSRFSIEVEQTKKKTKKGLRYADIQLTRSLLIVTWVFIILNLPNYLYRTSITFLDLYADVSHIQTYEQRQMMMDLSLLAHVLLYTHHAMLFYLYIFFSPQMKRRLRPTAMKLLECYCFKPPGDYSDT